MLPTNYILQHVPPAKIKKKNKLPSSIILQFKIECLLINRWSVLFIPFESNLFRWTCYALRFEISTHISQLSDWTTHRFGPLGWKRLQVSCPLFVSNNGWHIGLKGMTHRCGTSDTEYFLSTSRWMWRVTESSCRNSWWKWCLSTHHLPHRWNHLSHYLPAPGQMLSLAYSLQQSDKEIRCGGILPSLTFDRNCTEKTDC